MTLITSVSGIRGTIGGSVGSNLTPMDIVKYTAAYGTMLLQQQQQEIANLSPLTVVVGRDARISGDIVRRLVAATLQALGIHVVDTGLATTPTVEMAVIATQAAGGIILSASHNPKEWNALKLLNHKGEFISATAGAQLLQIAQNEAFVFAEVDKLGNYERNDSFLQYHIDQIVALPLVNVEAIRSKNYKIVIDGINSVGAIAVPALLQALGVQETIVLNATPDGKFAHNPEPLPEHLTNLAERVRSLKAHLGFAVDPDVDRLAVVCEDGDMFGEEYTLVAVADYILKHHKGSTVSNLSSSRALRDVTEKAGCNYFAAAVGEVHVVEKMKAVDAVIGGEGNGGIIYPPLHYGRDALVGIALFLSHLASSNKYCSLLRATYPNYYMVKDKIVLPPQLDMNLLLEKVRQRFAKYPANTEDGLKLEFDQDWVHLRQSNTEPIIRIYAESHSEVSAKRLTEQIKIAMKEILNPTA